MYYYLSLGSLCCEVPYTFTWMLLVSGFSLLCGKLYLYLNVTRPWVFCFLFFFCCCFFCRVLPYTLTFTWIVSRFSLLWSYLYLYFNVTCPWVFYCCVVTYTFALMFLVSMFSLVCGNVYLVTYTWDFFGVLYAILLHECNVSLGFLNCAITFTFYLM